jgi:GxxExxY protein
MPKGLEKHTALTSQIIAACYEVHNILGPGLEERFYRDALLHELRLRGISADREQEFGVIYKDVHLGKHRADIVVEDKILLELKAVSGKLSAIHSAQALSELRVSGLPVILLVNFGSTSVRVRRFEKRKVNEISTNEIS